MSERDPFDQELDALRARVRELEAELNHNATLAVCTWCQTVTTRDEIAAHIVDCVNHPVGKLARQFETERDALRAELAQARAYLVPCSINGLEFRVQRVASIEIDWLRRERDRLSDELARADDLIASMRHTLPTPALDAARDVHYPTPNQIKWLRDCNAAGYDPVLEVQVLRDKVKLTNDELFSHRQDAYLDGKRAQMERDCAAVCYWCGNAPGSQGKISSATLVEKQWIHKFDGPGYYDGETETCKAAAIRSAFALSAAGVGREKVE